MCLVRQADARKLLHAPPADSDRPPRAPGMAIAAFKAAGLHLYNDVVLLRCVGTASLFARNTFNSGAKMQPVRGPTSGSGGQPGR